jgi:hypothetical protein
MGQLCQQNAPGANLGDPVANLCARAEALCQQTAPRDLAGVPLYVVPQSALPADRGTAEACHGYTTPSLDLYLRDVIGPAWRGRGPCMVINDLALLGEAPDELETCFLATALHELAHILERPALYRERPNAEPARLMFEALLLAHVVAEPPSSEEARASLPHHGQRFIRAALHLRHRAEAAGVCIGAALVCPNRQYGLSHVNAYRAALGDEPIRLADARIRDVLASPPPQDFSRLWADDLAHWLSHHVSAKEKIA